MHRVSINSTVSKCIFKWLLTDHDFRSTIVFHPYYFVGYEKRLAISSDTNLEDLTIKDWMYILYKPMLRLIDQDGYNYSLQTMQDAYFTVVKPELSNYYTNPQNISPDIRANIEIVKNVLKSVFDSIEKDFTRYAEESVKKNAYIMAQQEAMITVQGKCAEFASYSYEDVSFEDLTRIYNQTSSACATMIESVSGDSGEYDDFFDSRLLIKIDNRMYPTAIEPLNFMLSGGFNSQTLTGFFTTTGGGKSTLLFTLMCDALKRGQNVYFVNLEMNDYEVNANILSGVTGRPRAEILDNLTNAEYIADLKKQVEGLHLGRHNIYSNRKKIDAQMPVNFNTLRTAIHQKEKSISRKIGEEFRYNIIIIDYLYLMETIGRSDSLQLYQQRKQLMVEAHDFAQAEEYAVISVFQANRQAAAKMTAGLEITAEDIGDSYSAMSDIDNMFVCQRKYDEESARSGIMVTDVKIRQMYDGDKKHFFVPYNFDLHIYDSWSAKYITPNESDTKVDNSFMKQKCEITLADVLDLNPELKEICGGTISTVCSELKKVSKCSYKNLTDEFEKRGWTLKKKSDFTEGINWEEMHHKVIDAVNRTLDAKKGKLQPAKDVKIGDDDVKITGDGLFDI